MPSAIPLRTARPLLHGLAKISRARPIAYPLLTRHCSDSSSPSKSAYQQALASNKRWVETTTSSDPSFFTTLAKGQAPPLLWLGCSDSRAPETTLLGLKPGDVFVHRNIANIVGQTDLSLASAVEFAVRHLRVQHVVLCGHTSCGGVNAALSNNHLPVLELWLQPLRALRERHAAELEKLEGAEKTRLLAEINVKAGVDVLRRMPTVVEAMRERGLEVHGVIYNLGTGLLDEVDTAEGQEEAQKRVAAFDLK